VLGTDLEAEEASDLVLPEGEKPKERTPQHLTYSAAFVRELHAFVEERLSDAVVRSFARQMESELPVCAGVVLHSSAMLFWRPQLSDLCTGPAAMPPVDLPGLLQSLKTRLRSVLLDRYWQAARQRLGLPTDARVEASAERAAALTGLTADELRSLLHLCINRHDAKRIDPGAQSPESSPECCIVGRIFPACHQLQMMCARQDAMLNWLHMQAPRWGPLARSPLASRARR